MDPVTPQRQGFVRLLLGLVLIGALALAALALYRSYTRRYVVSTDGSNQVAVAAVVAATLRGASELKVSTLSGTVQSTASDTRGFGWINSKRVMKAPFAVDYFVDVASLSPRDFIWDAKRRTLIVRAPGLRIGQPNIDEANTYLDQTTGVFVTRGAMAALHRQAAANAGRVAREEAVKPANVEAARANARRALARLFQGPLAAAGIDAPVEVRFVDGRTRDDERWDVTRSLEEVLANT